MSMNELEKKPLGPSAEESADIIPEIKGDRRALSRVPDRQGLRSNVDRRRTDLKQEESRDFQKVSETEAAGQRYLVDYPVELQIIAANGSKAVCAVRGKDISGTGMLIEAKAEFVARIKDCARLQLKFSIPQGSMPEGYEMYVDIGAKVIRQAELGDGDVVFGLLFAETLAQYAARRRYRYMLTISSLFLFLIVGIVVLMRTESIIYFKFNKMLYFYSILASTFLLTRYLFGAFYRPTPIDPDFTPGVSVIIPCFNEEKWIERTILGCINQDYPLNKLEVIVVDDGSTDDSVAKIQAVIGRLRAQEQRYEIDDRLRCIIQEENGGKREAMAAGGLAARHELLVFVDSDSILDPFAVRNIVQPFCDAEMGGVSGRTDVANTYTNTLTKMQAVRYYISFRIMKAAEGYFDAVTCLSGPLSCYRRDLVLKYMDKWRNQKFLGQKATFGDDRSLTNFILRHNRTGYQDTAICQTIVPNTYDQFLRQQMRWKRSWLRESVLAGLFMWRKEPFMALSFYMGLLVPILAPVIVVYNLIYIPLTHRVFPLTFLVGMSLMALMMSMAQLFLRKSTTWIFGIWFCLYYEAVLLWQMPIAWFTFWKPTWGTRMTPADVAAAERKRGPKS